jgi:predicted nuclease of predicted toxin-antitoxin system
MIKLYLDENVPEAIAVALRLRGHDIKTVKDAGRKGISDIDQLKYATSEDRAIFTFNIADFYKIHTEFMKEGNNHRGIILSKQLSIGIIVKALSKLLSSMSHKLLLNNIIWLSDWISKNKV